MDYPTNSHKARDGEDPPKVETKKIEKITQGEVVRRKKPLGKRFAETFVGGDAKGVWGYVTLDVLVPAAKDAIADAFSTGIERMLFGDSRGPSRRARSGYSGGHVSYNRFSSSSSSPYRDSPNDPRRQMSRRGRSQHDFDEIILETRVEAEEVIDRLFDLVSRYESATVADLYELVGVSGSFVDNKWGWTDIRGAGVTRVRNGYLLDLPKPDPLD